MTYWKDSLRPSSSHHCQISYITISHALLVAVCIFMLPILVPAAEHVQLTTTEPIKCFRHASLVLPPLDNVLPVLVLQLNMRGLPCSPSYSSVRRVSCNPGLSVPSGLGRTVVELLLILSGDIETNPGPVGGMLTPDDLGLVLEEVIEMCASWYRLGLQLSVRIGDLDRIRAQFSDPIDQLLEMLKTWLKSGVSTSWKTLTDALRSRSVGANQLAGVLETKYHLLEGAEVSERSQPAIVATLPGQLTTAHIGHMQPAPQPTAKRRRLDDDEIGTQGSIQTVPQPAVKQRRMDDDEIDAQGIQQVCVQREAVPLPEESRGDFGGIQQSSVCTTYQSYCSNVRSVYRRAPFQDRNSWPPMGRVKYVNLAILKSEKLTVSDDYTLMTIQRSVDDIVSRKKRIKFVELFDGLKSGSRVLVEGRPGCGKTTLLNRISLEWATAKVLKGIELLLLVPLRRFHSKANVELDDILQLYDTGHLCHGVGTQISLSGGKGVCIVLDGLDEYPRCSEPGNIVLELIEGRKLPNSVIIASSRPASAHHLRQYAAKRVEVLGFLRPEIQQYIQEHYKENSDKLKALNTYLEHHPNIRHMCYLPLHLAMVVYLNDVLESGSLPHTETGVYDKFMLYTLLRDMRRGSQSSMEHLSDVKQLHPEKLEVFRNICSLAFSATVQSEQIFSRKDVQKVFGSNDFNLESLGLLTEDKLFCEQGLEKTYSFAHLTFQEFLAAYHLKELPAAEQIEAVGNHVGEKHMGVVWKFYCGLTKLTGSVAMDVFRVLLQQDQLNDFLLIHSIHESQNQIACCELLSSRNGVLCITDEVLTPADMLAVAYCVRNASTSLTELTFQSCYLDREDLQVLMSECSYPLLNVKHLSLKKTLIRKKVVSSFFTFLERFPNLESFEFPKFSQPPSAEDLAIVFSSLKALKRLIADLIVIRSGGGILQLLNKIPTLETIRCCGGSLDLEVPKEFDKGTPIRVFMGKKRTIISVQTSAHYDLDIPSGTFPFNQLHETDTHLIAMLLKLCPRAQRIELFRVKISDAVWGILSPALKECRELQQLHLRECSIGDSGAIALAESLKSCTSLQSLDLHHCSIGDSGAVALVDCLRSCIKLQELDLSWNKFGDEGCAALSRGLKECRELKELSLGYNSLTDASIKSISEVITTVKSLKRLTLWGNNFTEGGEAQLQQAAEDRKSYPDFVELDLDVCNIRSYATSVFLYSSCSR